MLYIVSGIEMRTDRRVLFVSISEKFWENKYESSENLIHVYQ